MNKKSEAYAEIHLDHSYKITNEIKGKERMKQILLVSLLVVSTSCFGESSKEERLSDKSRFSGAEQAASGSMTTANDASMLDSAGINIDKSNPNWKTNLQPPKLMSFKPGQEIFWKLETNVGEMMFKLFPDIAPMHVTSTVYLTKLGFYDDVIFHRVIPGFMAQGGDPSGNGTGGPGYLYGGEFSPEVSHDRPGLLSMANRGPGTDGSQFFITFVPTPSLDGKHTIFGELVSGKETVVKLEKRGSRSGKTRERLMIVRASIESAM
jgi:peptidyl-prolyl cis-trans isomerase B (cyclophilin B)